MLIGAHNLLYELHLSDIIIGVISDFIICDIIIAYYY